MPRPARYEPSGPLWRSVGPRAPYLGARGHTSLGRLRRSAAVDVQARRDAAGVLAGVRASSRVGVEVHVVLGLLVRTQGARDRREQATGHGGSSLWWWSRRRPDEARDSGAPEPSHGRVMPSASEIVTRL